MPLLCSQCGIEQIDICDICKTPLNICDTIAELEHLNWRTFGCDIRDGINGNYDIIVNDAFLTRFKCSEKQAILRNIGQSLTSDGIYITTIRNDWNNGKMLLPSLVQQAAFVSKALRSKNKIKINIEDVRNSAKTYIERMISYPIENRSAIFDIANTVLKVIHCHRKNVVGEVAETSYFQIVFQNIN